MSLVVAVESVKRPRRMATETNSATLNALRHRPNRLRHRARILRGSVSRADDRLGRINPSRLPYTHARGVERAAVSAELRRSLATRGVAPKQQRESALTLVLTLTRAR